MDYRERPCLECGKVFKPKHTTGLFCCVPHKVTFNNRRRERGAEIYDLVMNEGLRSELAARAIAAYKLADKNKREGRRSYQLLTTALMRMPVAYGRDGDNR